MITSKQRAYLRSLANTVEPIFQIGKGGLNDNMIISIGEALEKRELIKIKVLDNSLESPREMAQNIALAINCEIVQVIGSKFVLYKESEENKKIQL